MPCGVLVNIRDSQRNATLYCGHTTNTDDDNDDRGREQKGTEGSLRYYYLHTMLVKFIRVKEREKEQEGIAGYHHTRVMRLLSSTPSVVAVTVTVAFACFLMTSVAGVKGVEGSKGK